MGSCRSLVGPNKHFEAYHLFQITETCVQRRVKTKGKALRLIKEAEFDRLFKKDVSATTIHTNRQTRPYLSQGEIGA